MGLKPVIIIKNNDGIIKVSARLRDNISQHEIVLNSVLSSYWANNLNPIEKLLELLESVIKRVINELMPHKDLYLKYQFSVDGNLENASQLQFNLLDVVADDVGFKIDGRKLHLKGLRHIDDELDNNTIFEETVEKHIETPDFVFKKYMERL